MDCFPTARPFSDRSLDLVLALDGSLQPAIVFCSTSGQRLGQVPPNNSVDFTVELLPIASGLQVSRVPRETVRYPYV